MKRSVPYLWAALLWAVFSIAVIAALGSGERIPLIEKFVVLWLACLIDFALLAAFGSVILRPRVDVKKAMILGTGKLLGLGLVGYVLWSSKGTSGLPILLGAFTLFVVPLAGAVASERSRI